MKAYTLTPVNSFNSFNSFKPVKCMSRVYLVSSVSISSRLSFVRLVRLSFVSRLCPSRLVCVYLIRLSRSSLVRLSRSSLVSFVRPSRLSSVCLVCACFFKRVKPVNSFKARRYSKCLNWLESMEGLKGFEVFGGSTHNSNAVHIDRWTI